MRTRHGQVALVHEQDPSFLGRNLVASDALFMSMAIMEVASFSSTPEYRFIWPTAKGQGEG